ncbi:MAG: hypothetical protein O9282_13040 [Flavobacterium sp.]|jgi:hypothetical protein|uniref:hypothetical protein n=1 Tax=Flavobacterium sp. TaxID=239 RepID=UPI0022C56435|nr:hypothetical protein [Flavobacterium sp.]MCZ8089401.1 hypothetical protein [Flavobacterium sp.]MCZ8332230.1 hypothetical protein [Flavobacterium sp.]
MKKLFIFFILFPLSVLGQETVKKVSLENLEIIEESEKFFFENLIDNKQNIDFKFVSIGDRLYNLKDSILLEKHPKYSFFKQPDNKFVNNFSTYLLDNLFKTKESNVLNNIKYVLKYSSNELYNFVIAKDGLKIDKYTLEISSPFIETLYKKEIRKIYFDKFGLIEKVEELVESNHKPDTLQLNRLTTFVYSKGIIKEKVIEHRNIHSGFKTQKDIFKFDSSGKLTEVLKETYNDDKMNLKKRTISTYYKYEKNNLIQVKSIMNEKNLLLYGYEIKYNVNNIEAIPLISRHNTYKYTLNK